MQANDYHLLDEDGAFDTMPYQGERRGYGTIGGGEAGPVPPKNGTELGDGDDDDGRDPENTRDMLWLYLKGQLKSQHDANERLTDAIDHQTQAIDAIRVSQDEQDKRHTDAQIVTAEKMAQAQVDAAEKAASARKFEAKMAAILAVFLIVGVLVLAGANVSGKYNGGELTAGHSTP